MDVYLTYLPSLKSLRILDVDILALFPLVSLHELSCFVYQHHFPLGPSDNPLYPNMQRGGGKYNLNKTGSNYLFVINYNIHSDSSFANPQDYSYHRQDIYRYPTLQRKLFIYECILKIGLANIQTGKKLLANIKGIGYPVTTGNNQN